MAIHNDPSRLLKDLFPSTFIGYDAVFEDAKSLTSNPSYPPHRITLHKHLDDQKVYHVDIAVAGFTSEDISVTETNKILYIEGKKRKDDVDPNVKTIFNNIAMRPFDLRLKLADTVSVKEIKMKDGILSVHLVEEIKTYKISHSIDLAD